MIAGFDIGGTKCAVTVGEKLPDDIRVLIRKEFATKGSPFEVIAYMVSLLREELQELGLSISDIDGVGISCGGPLNGEKGVILSPPNLPGWDDIHIVEIVEKELGVPAFLCNDADACALAEWQYGAGKGCKHMIFLTFGTGLGAGLILNGQLYTGANNFAGEVGHIRLDKYGPIGYGKMGSFEGFVSGGGIAMLARSLATERLQQGKTTAYCSSYAELERVDAKSVADAARQGDETANAVYRITGEMLGRGLSILVDLLNPERIVIGSIFGRAEALLRPHMERVMREECLPMSYGAVSVVPAGLGESIGDLAALALAMSADEG